MPEKQRRPQDKPLRGGVGAVYRRAILPCQMRNDLKFRFFVSSFAIAVRSEPKLCVNASADKPYSATEGAFKHRKERFSTLPDRTRTVRLRLPGKFHPSEAWRR